MMLVIILINLPAFAQTITAFRWPQGKHAAVSLTFDDARLSQVASGLALLDLYGIKATFFVVPSNVEKRIDGWKKAVASGHEIGNHTLHHPCTGNFSWSRKTALEEYTLQDMRKEITEGNERIHQLLGVVPEVFAYPCGQKFVGRSLDTKSYVPLVAELFILGRGWLDETSNDPNFCDFAQITGIEMDEMNFDQILPLLEEAKMNGKWLVLAGHEMGKSGVQTTRLKMLRKLLEHGKDPANGIWIAPAGTVAKFIRENRK